MIKFENIVLILIIITTLIVGYYYPKLGGLIITICIYWIFKLKQVIERMASLHERDINVTNANFKAINNNIKKITAELELIKKSVNEKDNKNRR